MLPQTSKGIISKVVYVMSPQVPDLGWHSLPLFVNLVPAPYLLTPPPIPRLSTPRSRTIILVPEYSALG